MKTNFLSKQVAILPTSESNVLWRLHLVAGLLHTIQFVIVVVMITASVFPVNAGLTQLTRQVTKWTKGSDAGTQSFVGNFTASLVQVNSIRVDIKWMIATFFALAGLDHLSTIGICYWMPASLQEVGARMRLLEYSVSGSLVAVSIAVQTGITDLYTLSGIFFLMASCMLFGLLAEFLTVYDDWRWARLAHFLGWIPFVAGYWPILDAYFTALAISDTGVKPPWFVTVIVFSEFVLFCNFGLAQLLYLYGAKLCGWGKSSARWYSEVTFLILSILAKSNLAWNVLAPLLMT